MDIEDGSVGNASRDDWKQGRRARRKHALEDRDRGRDKANFDVQGVAAQNSPESPCLIFQQTVSHGTLAAMPMEGVVSYAT
jgi:hypothetical protein